MPLLVYIVCSVIWVEERHVRCAARDRGVYMPLLRAHLTAVSGVLRALWLDITCHVCCFPFVALWSCVWYGEVIMVPTQFRGISWWL